MPLNVSRHTPHTTRHAKCDTEMIFYWLESLRKQIFLFKTPLIMDNYRYCLIIDRVLDRNICLHKHCTVVNKKKIQYQILVCVVVLRDKHDQLSDEWWVCQRKEVPYKDCYELKKWKNEKNENTYKTKKNGQFKRKNWFFSWPKLKKSCYDIRY